MAFITTMKNREGNTYVYLKESYREGDKVKQRTLVSYGKLEDLEKDEPGILERLKREAKENKLTPEKTIQAQFALDAPMNQPDKSYGWKVLDDIFEELGLATFVDQYNDKRSKTKLSKVLKLLVYQRILAPNSKLKTFENKDLLFGDWDVTLQAIYRSLGRLEKIKEDIEFHLHKRITTLTNRTPSLVFYDVTNYYFETDLDDEEVVDEDGEIIKQGLRRRGPSKEHRPKPIVQLGLFMDTNGIPISYRLFRGNQVDSITYLPAVEQVKKQFGFDKIVVVADKAMNSSNNVLKTHQDGNGWLFSQKHRGRRGAPKDIQAFILEDSDWEWNHELTFAKKSKIRERVIQRANKKQNLKEITVKEKVLVTWNKKYAKREQIRRDGAIEYAEKLTNAQKFRETAKKGGKKYLKLELVDKETGEIKPFSPLITIDQESVDFDAQFDGIHVIVTSEIHMSDEEILSAYRELSVIEDCFRVSKMDFETRPVYVRKEEHIEGHFLTCYIALILMRMLQHRIDWELSPTRIAEALSSSKATFIKQGYYRLQENEDMAHLNELMGIDWKKGFVPVETLNKYGKGWYTTK